MASASHPPTPDQDPARMFRDAWRLYRKILDHNYMFHREMNDAVARALATRFGDEALAVLELGCGDGSQSRLALGPLRLEAYRGCDMSEPALALAAAELDGMAGTVRLDNADMLDYLSREGRACDLVYSSFALHHLDAAGKQRFFDLSRAALKPGGMLILVDVLRQDGEDRETYLDAYLGHARLAWDALADEEFQTLAGHVRACDFPESPADLAAMARRAGFPAAVQLARRTWHGALAFSPS